ncbi:FdtA/QdtA family cupin domain-containing protein [Candidatus Peregrinibacteria bacterium]|nr:FdtA/QdtA family cupin domain-containing protein [Candidatus Peregrinibacteria bacterium]
MKPFEFFKLANFTDEKGSLVPLELKNYINWTPKRVYYAFNNKDFRGGHCHKIEKELFICPRGSFKIRLHDGKNWTEQVLKGPDSAVRVDNLVWHEFTDFSKDAILLAVSSTNYNKDDYIRDFDQYLKSVNEH